MVEESCIQKIHLTDRLFLECILRASAVCVEILRVIVLSNRSACVGVRTVPCVRLSSDAFELFVFH